MAVDKRSYDSPLREQRAEETRQRILDGATVVLAEGAAALTIPAVARASGVAVPTVYRYFATKEDLEDGVAAHVRARVGVSSEPGPQDLESLFQAVRDLFTNIWSVPRSHLAVLLSSVGRSLQGPDEHHDERIAFAADPLREALADLDPDQRRRAVIAVAALCSSPTAVAFLRLGIEADEAAALHEFVVRAVVEKALRDAP